MPSDRTVLYDSSTEKLLFGAVGRGGDFSFYVHADDLVGRKVVDLRDALLDASAHGGPASMRVSSVPVRQFDEENSTVDPIESVVHDGHLLVDIDFFVDMYEDQDLQALDLVQSVLRPLETRLKFETGSAAPNLDYVQGPPWLWHARLVPRYRGRLLPELHRLALEAVALLEASPGGSLTRLTLVDLLRAGHVNALLGQPEGPWLEAKGQHYDLSKVGGKVALAQAVARFANAAHGGVVVVGLETKNVPGREEIRRVSPVPRDPRIVRKYHAALETHLIPPPDLLENESIDLADGMLVLVHVPPQPEEHKPFLVHGAIVDGRTEGAFISVVRRRGEASIPISAQALHATLAAGRALL